MTGMFNGIRRQIFILVGDKIQDYLSMHLSQKKLNQSLVKVLKKLWIQSFVSFKI